jgi:hypothetical protein
MTPLDRVAPERSETLADFPAVLPGAFREGI